MNKRRNKRKKSSKNFFKILHIIVILLKYILKILKELKSIIDLFKNWQKTRYAANIPSFLVIFDYHDLLLNLVIWTKRFYNYNYTIFFIFFNNFFKFFLIIVRHFSFKIVNETFYIFFHYLRALCYLNLSRVLYLKASLKQSLSLLLLLLD